MKIDDKKDDNVNHPSHYTQGSIECVHIIELLDNPLLGNVLKYLWRFDKKGKPLEDIEKAIKYHEEYRLSCGALGIRPLADNYRYPLQFISDRVLREDTLGRAEEAIHVLIEGRLDASEKYTLSESRRKFIDYWIWLNKLLIELRDELEISSIDEDELDETI